MGSILSGNQYKVAEGDDESTTISVMPKAKPGEVCMGGMAHVKIARAGHKAEKAFKQLEVQLLGRKLTVWDQLQNNRKVLRHVVKMSSLCEASCFVSEDTGVALKVLTIKYEEKDGIGSLCIASEEGNIAHAWAEAFNSFIRSEVERAEEVRGRFKARLIPIHYQPETDPKLARSLSTVVALTKVKDAASS
jgi:hypothetical protein